MGDTESATATPGSSEESSGSSTEDSNSASESGDPLPAVCECAETSVSACGGSKCGHVSLECDYDCHDEEGNEIDNLPALECALTALRDRSPGVVTWSWRENGGQYQENISLAVLADGRAIIGGSGSHDIEECPELPTRYVELKSAAFFDACLDKEDPVSRFNCLRGGIETTLFTCKEGYCFEGA